VPSRNRVRQVKHRGTFHKLKIITRNKMRKVGEKSEKYKTNPIKSTKGTKGENSPNPHFHDSFILTIVVKKISVTDVHI
jgi:hypothetical protein